MTMEREFAINLAVNVILVAIIVVLAIDKARLRSAIKKAIKSHFADIVDNIAFLSEMNESQKKDNAEARKRIKDLEFNNPNDTRMLDWIEKQTNGKYAILSAMDGDDGIFLYVDKSRYQTFRDAVQDVMVLAEIATEKRGS